MLGPKNKGQPGPRVGRGGEKHVPVSGNCLEEVMPAAKMEVDKGGPTMWKSMSLL